MQEDQDWEGKIQAIKSIVTTSAEKHQALLSDNNDKLTNLERNIQGPLAKVVDLEEKINSLKGAFEDMIDKQNNQDKLKDDNMEKVTVMFEKLTEKIDN